MSDFILKKQVLTQYIVQIHDDFYSVIYPNIYQI